jgi:hypothetical protein
VFLLLGGAVGFVLAAFAGWVERVLEDEETPEFILVLRGFCFEARDAMGALSALTEDLAVNYFTPRRKIGKYCQRTKYTCGNNHL